MSSFVQVGDFCPNEQCRAYQQLQTAAHRNLKKNGHSKAGRQRYLCKCCGQTFSETKGTLFYRRRTPSDQILETLAWLAEGARISSISRVKGYKEDTILSWLREAEKQAASLEAVLLQDYQIERGQLDALWSYVKNKGAKKTIQRPN